MKRILFALIVSVFSMVPNVGAGASSELILDAPTNHDEDSSIIDEDSSIILVDPDSEDLHPVRFNKDTSVQPLEPEEHIDTYVGYNTSESIESLKNTIEVQTKEIELLKSDYVELREQFSNLEPKENNYYGWVATLLACVTVAVTILGVIMAVFSFIGFKQVKQESAKAAQDIALQEVKQTIGPIAVQEINRLVEEGELNEQIIQIVKAISESEGAKKANDFSKYPEFDNEFEEGDEK